MNKHLHLNVQALITVEPGAYRIVEGFITGSKAKTLVYVLHYVSVAFSECKFKHFLSLDKFPVEFPAPCQKVTKTGRNFAVRNFWKHHHMASNCIVG